MEWYQYRHNKEVANFRISSKYSFNSVLGFCLTIIPRTRVGGRGAGHGVSYNKFISNNREWNNCLF